MAAINRVEIYTKGAECNAYNLYYNQKTNKLRHEQMQQGAGLDNIVQAQKQLQMKK